LEIVNVGGRIITPGIVDMHSHMGVDSWPELRATDDTNDMVDPTYPQLRTLDAFNPHDPAIKRVASGGVTTALILPGSGNLMGGETFAFKLRPVANGTAEGMLVNSGLPQGTGWRWMKMACGENPKNVYSAQNRAPTTRMGEAWLFRQRLERAQKLKRHQDNWCAAAERLDGSDSVLLSEAFPESLEDESLVALLRGKVKLNVHCYETYDLEMLFRVMNEFNVPVAAIHHALDAYRVPELVRRNNVTVATFADLWGYKKEAYQASVNSPRILAEHGIPVAIKSDHPVINSQYLVEEAAKAHHYGLDSKLALASVTSVPANALGLGDRLGRLQPGYDADVVVWDVHPLALGARPLQVFIDGLPQLNTTDDLSNTPHPFTSVRPGAQRGRTKTSKIESKEALAHPLTRTERNRLQGDDAGREISVVVKNGGVACVGLGCEDTFTEANGDIYDLHGGVVLPGIISAGLPLGMIEIEQEPSTGDGSIEEAFISSSDQLPRAEDGIAFGGKHLKAALAAGVTTTISPPMAGDAVIAGISVAAHTAGQSVLDDEASIVKEMVALHVRIGQGVASGAVSSVSQQINALRQLLLGQLPIKANQTQPDYFADVVAGKIPLVVHTNGKDIIAAIIKMRNEVRWRYKRSGGKGDGAYVIIYGGADAHLIAPDLVAEDVPVVLQPARCQPSTWTSRHCLAGQPLTRFTNAQALHHAGVRVSLAAVDIAAVRNLIWEAGYHHNRDPTVITEASAVGLVTWGLADAFQLPISAGRIQLGKPADLVAYDGSPFQFGSRITLVSSAQFGVVCHPQQA
ncbi:hypothetical protein THASP1DRAFT_19507, partial [Thamnocephalis sphaerospora]